MRSSVITTFPSLTKPSPASANATAVTPVASSSVTSAIAAVAAARAAQAQAQAAATIAATVTPPITTAASIVTTVNGRKRRNSNSSSNGLSPTYARMENSSNLSQSMDSVNTASGEEEVSNSVSFFRSLCRLLTLVVVVVVVVTRTRIIKLNEAVFSTKDDRTSLMLLLSKPPFFSSHLLPAKCFESSNGINADEMTT